jgi:predicted Zn finger-like uncharacterized protein
MFVSIHARCRATSPEGEVFNRNQFLMKTRCPGCQTVFRVTPEQIKAHAGKVRCGHCRGIFNALDGLFDEGRSNLAVNLPTPADPIDTRPEIRVEPEFTATAHEIPLFFPASVPEAREAEESERLPPHDAPPEMPEPDDPGGLDGPDEPYAPDEPPGPGLVFPRATSELAGYSKWAEGVMAPPIAFPAERPSRRPFWLVAAGLALALAGQAVFHFRGELAISMPGLRPALDALSRVVDGPLPLPRHDEMISIEASDLQTDASKGNLLVLNTTLRNNAHYGQAYPSLELSLTDTQDTVIARRIFSPRDYLPARVVADPAFPGDSGVTVRLWIEAVDLAAAGYRLLVFYP